MDVTVEVIDRGTRIAFSFADVLRYHGPGSPGGAAIGFTVLACALPLLVADGSAERREIFIETAFGGPGARDAFELVTRAVTGDRFRLDPALVRPERGRLLERFVFRLSIGTHAVTLLLREGFVTAEFLDLARAETRDAAQDLRLTLLKQQLADRVMACPADEAYEVAPTG
jgi:hypothetical protein